MGRISDREMMAMLRFLFCVRIFLQWGWLLFLLLRTWRSIRSTEYYRREFDIESFLTVIMSKQTTT
jgi:hypothetical protein